MLLSICISDFIVSLNCIIIVSDSLRSSSVSVILLCVFKANVIYNFVACISSLLKQGIQYLMLFPSLVGLCQMLFPSLVGMCQMLFPSLVGLCQVVFQELVQNIPEKFQLFFFVILSLFHIIYDYHCYYHHHHRDTCLSSGDWPLLVTEVLACLLNQMSRKQFIVV